MPLYKATTKFNWGCGWSAFFQNLPGKVLRRGDATLGKLRMEIVCASCGGHLGHVFKGEGYDTLTDERHCMNNVSLKFLDSAGGKGVIVMDNGVGLGVSFLLFVFLWRAPIFSEGLHKGYSVLCI